MSADLVIVRLDALLAANGGALDFAAALVASGFDRPDTWVVVDHREYTDCESGVYFAFHNGSWPSAVRFAAALHGAFNRAQSRRIVAVVSSALRVCGADTGPRFFGANRRVVDLYATPEYFATSDTDPV